MMLSEVEIISVVRNFGFENYLFIGGANETNLSENLVGLSV